MTGTGVADQVAEPLAQQLAAAVPGPALAALLASLDLSTVPNAETVEVLRAAWRQVSHSYATYLTAMVEVGRAAPYPDDGGAHRLVAAWEWSTAEIGAALTFTGRRTDTEFVFAQTLVEHLPLVFAALQAGRIDHFKARVYAEHLTNLTPAQTERICVRLLPRTPAWTTGQLAARLLREIHAIDPLHTRRRYQRAIRERGVSGHLAPDGTATLTAHGLSPTEAAAAADRLEELAEAARRAGYPGTSHQVRADLFVRLLDGRYDGLTRDQIITAMLADPPTCGEPLDDEAVDEAADDPAGGVSDNEAAGDDPFGSGPHNPFGTGPGGNPGSGSATDPATDSHGTGFADATHGVDPDDEEPPATSAADHHATARDHGGGAPVERPRHGIEVRISLTTLLGLDDHPAELPGWGPIVAADARLLVARQHAAEWRFAVTDADEYLVLGGITRRRPHRSTSTACRGGVIELHIPATALTQLAGRDDLPPGWATVIADIARQYAHRDTTLQSLDSRPHSRFASAALRRHVEIRDRTCIAPGCRRAARKTEQDHTRDHHHGGLTVQANLEPLCALHHAMKHQGRWRLEQTRPGHFRWHSPLGQTYLTRGDPITPDLPDPVPRNPDDHGTDDGTTGQMVELPIITWKPGNLPPPKKEPPPVDLDDLPPF